MMTIIKKIVVDRSIVLIFSLIFARVWTFKLGGIVLF